MIGIPNIRIIRNLQSSPGIFLLSATYVRPIPYTSFRYNNPGKIAGTPDRQPDSNIKRTDMNNRTLSIVKPDAVADRHTGKILNLIEKNGFRIIAMKMIQFTPIDVIRFYTMHKDRPFFKNLTLFMTAGPVVVLVLEKENAVASFRELIGNTDPREASTGTIRCQFGHSKTRNAIHASDSDENAMREISFFFSEREITGNPYQLPVPEKESDA